MGEERKGRIKDFIEGKDGKGEKAGRGEGKR